jgi:hypothetical protein
MTDGHCAAASEVIFVDYRFTTCPGTGSATSPYCTFASALTVLAGNRRVIVVVGGADDRISLTTTGISPVLIGRKNTAGDVGSIPATGMVALSISSDTVLVRDLTLNAGTSATLSKGVVVSGAGTNVTLLRVTANLTTGLGVDAETGTTISMDECYVLNNSAGGILVNGASYSIQNTVIAGNGGTAGYGVQLSMPGSGSQFWFNTVVNNPIAATCDLVNPASVSNSIVAGPVANCMTVDSVTIAPTFDSARPYHLTAHLACPLTPATSPTHDIDGDPRTPPVDCGADQFVP